MYKLGLGTNRNRFQFPKAEDSEKKNFTINKFCELLERSINMHIRKNKFQTKVAKI